MIDLHTHSVFSDGELIPAELVRRFESAGYEAVAITDHGDLSNLDFIIPRLVAFCDAMNPLGGMRVVPGIELTHIRPMVLAAAIERSKTLGARLVVVHGETIVEPVAKGTNRAAIEAGADILAHPGLITEEEVVLARDHGVYLELTYRKGHSLSNGHVARLAKQVGASLLVNGDVHSPADIWPGERLGEVILAAGLSNDDVAEIMANARKVVERCLMT